MGRRKEKKFDLKGKLAKLAQAGLRPATDAPASGSENLDTLQDRIAAALRIIKSKPVKATEMTSLIMYDITDDKVRTLIAKYLIKQGCVRIQKSVFLARLEQAAFEDIHQTLKEVNSYYNNEDSIILVPVNASDVRSMKLIGKNVNIEAITDKPNTLFF